MTVPSTVATTTLAQVPPFPTHRRSSVASALSALVVVGTVEVQAMEPGTAPTEATSASGSTKAMEDHDDAG